MLLAVNERRCLSKNRVPNATKDAVPWVLRSSAQHAVEPDSRRRSLRSLWRLQVNGGTLG